MNIHPKASKQCVRVFRQVHRETGEWSYREVARRLDVNVKYVWQNLTEGKEPPMPLFNADGTPKTELDAQRVELRRKMGLKTGEKRARSEYAIMPRWYARTPEVLARYQHTKSKIKQMVDETRAEQFKYRKPRKNEAQR